MKKREMLPPEYHLTIAEIDGRYYPVRTEETPDTTTVKLGSYPQLRWDVQLDFDIPYALGPQPTAGLVSFPTRKAALDYCHRWNENILLLIQWRQKNAENEFYAERNAWYLEELSQMTGKTVSIDTTLYSGAYASVFLNGHYCFAYEATVDEAITVLYETVFQRAHQKQLI